MKRETYKIPVTWTVWGLMEIDHDGLEMHNSKKLLNK